MAVDDINTTELQWYNRSSRHDEKGTANVATERAIALPLNHAGI
jgi:hypothetical protein